MCECLRHEDGTWHVCEACAWIMDEYHTYGIDALAKEIKKTSKVDEYGNIPF